MEVCKGGGERELDGVEDAAVGDDDRNAHIADARDAGHKVNAST